MADAKIFDKGPGEKVTILNVRAWHLYPFQAPNWLDLRVGWFLSLTQAGADDTITGLAETIPAAIPTGFIEPKDRVWIGCKTRAGPIFPTSGSGTFIGFINDTNPTTDSKLVSSDIGIGTTNSNFWRPTGSVTDFRTACIIDGQHARRSSNDGVEYHFPQSVGGAGGYAVLLGMRLTRPNANSRTITCSIKSNVRSSDIIYSSTPSKALIETNLVSFPAGVQQLGPIELSAVPDAFFFYWPFFNSRLRIHSVGIVKVS